MNVIRAFIAIDLSSEIYQRLDEVLADIRKQLPRVPVRWVPAQNIHLTLKFLGNVSMTNLDLLKDMLQAEVGQHASFEISVGDLSAFPSIRRPRVIYVGVEATHELFAVQRGIESGTFRLGYATEDREFSPHLTLGRVPRNASSDDIYKIASVLDSTKIGFLGATRVRSIILYRSDIKPGGAVYTKIVSVPLATLS